MSYTITSKTLALYNNVRKTKIYEITNSFVINEALGTIIANNCLINGSTLEGRQKASSYLIGSNYKPPILLDNEHHIIMFPTHSTRNKACAWLNLSSILTYYACKNGVQVEFRCGKKLYFNISFHIFDNQVLRATRLESALRGRNNKKYL